MRKEFRDEDSQTQASQKVMANVRFWRKADIDHRD
jgi:hypothetical protein